MSGRAALPLLPRGPAHRRCRQPAELRTRSRGGSAAGQGWMWAHGSDIDHAAVESPGLGQPDVWRLPREPGDQRESPERVTPAHPRPVSREVSRHLDCRVRWSLAWPVIGVSYQMTRGGLQGTGCTRCWRCSGSPAAEIAAPYGASSQSVYGWKARYERGGAAGLADRSRRSRTSPQRISARAGALVCACAVPIPAGVPGC
jgi:Helix-turn-helix domain